MLEMNFLSGCEIMKKIILILMVLTTALLLAQITYPVVDTGQNQNYNYNNQIEIAAPSAGETFYYWNEAVNIINE